MLTIFDIALALDRQAGIVHPDDRMTGADLDRLRLPMFGGCAICEASLAAFNAVPTRSGFLACEDCASPEAGYETLVDFLADNAE